MLGEIEGVLLFLREVLALTVRLALEFRGCSRLSKMFLVL